MNRTVPLILAVALFMENMDSTVIATSLPAIATDIGTSPIALKLALTAYLVSLAIFIPISSWMADRYGARRIFRFAIGIFVIGSVACAISSSLPEFVLARFLQGIGGAMMTPVARLVLVRATAKRELVSAMAWLTIPGLIGPLVGPPIGGFITTFFTWHWIFLINVPIGIAGIWLAGRFLPEIPPAGTKRLDVRGFLLSAIAASGVVFGLSVVSLPALPPIVGIVTLLVGIVSALLYLRHARRVPDPILDFRLFRNPVFRAAISGGVLFRIGSGATPFLLPLLFQLGFGLTPFQSGMLTFASAFGAMAMKFLASVTLRTGGFRNVLIGSTLLGGMFIAASAFFTPETPHGADHSGADRRRLPAVALLHLGERPGLRRHRRQGCEPGDRNIGRLPANQHRRRRRGRRRHSGSHELRDRRADQPAFLYDRFPDRRSDHRTRVDPVSAVAQRCGKLRVRPRLEQTGGRRTAADRLTAVIPCP